MSDVALTAREQTIALLIKELAEQLGHMPVHAEFVDADLKPLYSAASNGRGMPFYAELLGLEPQRASTASVYWTDERMLEGLRELADSIGRLPVRGDFVAAGEDILYKALTTSEHGYGYYASQLDARRTPLSRGGDGAYWTRERVEEELLGFLAAHGLRRIPTAGFFREHDATRLHRAARSTGGLMTWHQRVAGSDFQRALRLRENDDAGPSPQQ